MSGRAHQALILAAVLALTAIGAAAVRPVAPQAEAAPDLDRMLPEAFAGWRRIDLSAAVLPQEIELAPGEAVAYRAYTDELGRIVTLVAAYGPPLGDSVRLHRPEACYVAQGFAIRSRETAAIAAAGRTIAIVNLDTEGSSRREAVSYWLRNGATFTTGDGDSGWRRLAAGPATPLDGALVRVSTVNAERPNFDLNRDFMTAFAAALTPEARAILLGAESGA